MSEPQKRFLDIPYFFQRENESGELIHVYPTFGKEHVTKGTQCWCEPVLTPDNVLIHNSEQ